MIILAEMNCIAKGLTEAQQKVVSLLTAKDKFLLICDKNTTVAMNIVQLFMDLKVKPQFIEVEAKDKFALGFQYGILAATYPKEKIVVRAEEDHSAIFTSNMENCKESGKSGRKSAQKPAAEGPQKTAQKPVAEVAQKSAQKPAAEGTQKSAQKPAAEVAQKSAQKQVPEAAKKSTQKAVQEPAQKSSGSRTRLKDLSNASLLAKYALLEPYKEQINRMGEGMIKDAIDRAADGDVGLKFQLTMVFGMEAGEGIWKIIKKDFKKLKEML